jgi:hypothetical protein
VTCLIVFSDESPITGESTKETVKTIAQGRPGVPVKLWRYGQLSRAANRPRPVSPAARNPGRKKPLPGYPGDGFSVAPHRSINAKIDRLGPNSFPRRACRRSKLKDRFHPNFTVSKSATFLDHALRLAQTQADRGSRSALRSIGRTTAGAKYRHQGFVRLAAHSAVGLYRSDGRAGLSGISLWSDVAFCSGSALRSLWALGASQPLSPGLPLCPRLSLSARLALCSRHALDALRALRTGRTLRAGFAFGTRGPRISAATGECQ